MRQTDYNKKDVISDIVGKSLTSQEIADKYGITIGNVYTIKAVAKRTGVINARGFKSMQQRVKEERSVFNPALRRRIKEMRNESLTTTEITDALNKEGLNVLWEDVGKVLPQKGW